MTECIQQRRLRFFYGKSWINIKCKTGLLRMLDKNRQNINGGYDPLTREKHLIFHLKG